MAKTDKIVWQGKEIDLPVVTVTPPAPGYGCSPDRKIPGIATYCVTCDNAEKARQEVDKVWRPRGYVPIEETALKGEIDYPGIRDPYKVVLVARESSRERIIEADERVRQGQLAAMGREIKRAQKTENYGLNQ